MAIRLRAATKADEDQCLTLLRPAEEGDARILAAMHAADSTTYLAYADDSAQPIGATVMHWHETEAEIVYIAMAENQRGRGMGRQAVSALMEEARIRRCSAVLVGTANASLDNIAFYQKCGFRMDHVRRGYFDYLPEPVIENGIPIRDMIVFRFSLV